MFVFREFLDLLFEVVDKDVIFFLHFMDGVGHFCCLVVVVKQHMLRSVWTSTSSPWFVMYSRIFLSIVKLSSNLDWIASRMSAIFLRQEVDHNHQSVIEICTIHFDIYDAMWFGFSFQSYNLYVWYIVILCM